MRVRGGVEETKPPPGYHSREISVDTPIYRWYYLGVFNGRYHHGGCAEQVARIPTSEDCEAYGVGSKQKQIENTALQQ